MMKKVNWKSILFFGFLFAAVVICPIFVFGANDSQVVYVKFKNENAKNKFLKNNPNAESSKIKNLVRYKPSNFLDSKIFSLKAKSQDIEYMETAEMYKPLETADDTYFNSAWHFSNIYAQNAWDISKGSANHIIAVIDTGVKLNHQDLDSKIWINTGEIAGNHIDDDGNGYVDDVNGYDFADDDEDPSPDLANSQYYHGTKVSGVAAAETDNAQGVAGISWYAKIMPLKVFEDGQPVGPEIGAWPDDIANAITYAADNGAKIINLSLGSYAHEINIANAVNYAYYNKNCIIVAAAGNDGYNYASYPARYSKVIGVGATNYLNQIPSWSNRGDGVDLYAPGSSIYTTNVNPVYVNNASGTSFSSPMVAGAISVILNTQTNLTSSQMQAKLAALTSPISGSSYRRLNLYKNLKFRMIRTSYSASYFVDGTRRYRMINSIDFWQRFGVSSTMTETVGSGTFNSYSYQGFLKPLWKSSSGRIYYINKATKIRVMHLAAFFQKYGYSWNDVIRINDSKISQYPSI